MHLHETNYLNDKCIRRAMTKCTNNAHPHHLNDYFFKSYLHYDMVCEQAAINTTAELCSCLIIYHQND